ncbi:MBL fold metallo-hydrolase [Roseibium sp. HPY-6]|uniref:MBL fold metallo-hydrolase n=1 Tax=Roseibium sp. HPY-6 TaxID=3229852 RepID=UPI00338FB02D
MTDIDLELVTYEGLDERIVVVRAGDEVDSVFVLTERFGVLVDTLATPGLCARALELLADRLTDRPLVVINSHMDWDHYWGNAALDADTQIIAHSEAIKRLQDPNTGQELAEKRSQEARFQEVEIVPPTMTFSGRTMSLHGGDLTLELIHTPGHTPDHVAVWIPELRTCLAVDAVEDPIPEVWSQSPDDLRNLCLSLKQIRELHPRHAILAHGQTADPEIIDRNIEYFSKLRDAIRVLPNVSQATEGLSEQPRFQLEDFVVVSSNMPLEARAFYQRCHKSNLNAVVAACRAGVDFL